jgi:hypothetical protein
VKASVEGFLREGPSEPAQPATAMLQPEMSVTPDRLQFPGIYPIQATAVGHDCLLRGAVGTNVTG